MKFEEKSYYEPETVKIAKEVPADVLDKEIEESRKALEQLEKQRQLEQQAANLEALQQAKKRQEDAAIAESILSQAVVMTSESVEANKAKIADWQEKFRELARLHNELSSEYSEIQKSLLDSGLKLRNAAINAAQIEPTPDNGHVTGPQDGYIRLAELMNKTGLTDAGLDIRPSGLSTVEDKLFSILADDRPGTRYKPQLGSKNFDFITW